MKNGGLPAAGVKMTWPDAYVPKVANTGASLCVEKQEEKVVGCALFLRQESLRLFAG